MDILRGFNADVTALTHVELLSLLLLLLLDKLDHDANN